MVPWPTIPDYAQHMSYYDSYSVSLESQKMFKLPQCRTVDFTSVDTRSSEREAATFSRMHEITSSYQRSAIYQNMLAKVEQSLQWADKPAIPFKSKDSPSGAAKLEVLLRSVFSPHRE